MWMTGRWKNISQTNLLSCVKLVISVIGMIYRFSWGYIIAWNLILSYLMRRGSRPIISWGWVGGSAASEIITINSSQRKILLNCIREGEKPFLDTGEGEWTSSTSFKMQTYLLQSRPKSDKPSSARTFRLHRNQRLQSPGQWSLMWRVDTTKIGRPDQSPIAWLFPPLFPEVAVYEMGVAVGKRDLHRMFIDIKEDAIQAFKDRW